MHIGDRRLVYSRTIDQNENNETGEDSFDESMEIEPAANTSLDMSTEESHGENIENVSIGFNNMSIEESHGKLSYIRSN